MAFVARTTTGAPLLWVRSLDALDAVSLPGTEDAFTPAWSPDGGSVAFGAGVMLKTIAASGGPVRSLGDAPATIVGITWSTDGVIVFAAQAAGLYRISANGGTPAILTRPDATRGETAHLYPAFLPNGRRFLYWTTPSNTVMLGSLDGNEPIPLFTADSPAAYADPGYLLFVRQGTLVAQPFDPRRAAVIGEAIPVAERVYIDGSGAAAFAVASAGALVYRTGSLDSPTQLTWFDRMGRRLSEVGQPGRYRNPALSPDRTRVALEVIDPQGRSDIWILEMARGVMSRFTFDSANDVFPTWSPDGRWLMFASDRGGVFNLYRKLANGTGAEELILKSMADMAPFSWAPDASAIVYRTSGGGGVVLGILPLVGDPKPRLFEQTRFVETVGEVSPNGRWLVYGSNESGTFEIYAQSFPLPGRGKWQISKGGGLRARWRGDGRELFYHAYDGRLMAVPVSGDTALEIGAPVPLFDAPMLGGPTPGPAYRQQFDVTRDGRRFLLNVPTEDAGQSSITVVLNWTAALKK